MLDDLIAQEKAEQASALLDSARLIETGAVTAESDISADLNAASLIYQGIIGGDDHFEQCEDAGDDAEDASSLDELEGLLEDAEESSELLDEAIAAGATQWAQAQALLDFDADRTIISDAITQITALKGDCDAILLELESYGATQTQLDAIASA